MTGLFLGLLVALPLYGGSYFASSPQGIGLRQYWTNARGLGMGGTGLATPDQVSLNAYTTSLWRSIRDTRAQFLLQYNQNQTELAQSSFTRSTANFGGIVAAVPIKQQKVVFGASLYPYSDMNFKFSFRNSQNNLTYRETVFLEGNISRAQLSLVWSPTPSLGLGIAGNYYFGLLRDQYLIAFDNANYFNSGHVIEYNFRGAGASFSLDFVPVPKLSFGGFVDLKPIITIERMYNSSTSNATEQITDSGSLPWAMGVGSSLKLNSQWTAALDYAYQNWSEGFGIGSQSLSELSDWYYIGIGFERGNRSSDSKKIYDKLDFRGGFSISQLGYKFNGADVKEYAGHFGVGIPFFFHVNRIDLGIKAGVRGNKGKNQAQEKFVQMIVSVSVGELWFQRPR